MDLTAIKQFNAARLAGLGVAAILGFGAPAAVAHPHVWVTGASTLRFQDSRLASIGMRWQFDGFFSQVLTGDFDKNQDGTFDAEETAAMKEQVFTSLRDYGYFTHLRINDVETVFDRVENFSIGTDKGELVYVFDLLPAAPIELANVKAHFSLYDPTVYVDIILGGDKPLILEGVSADKCTWSFGTGDEISNPNGFITPQVVQLSCKT
ncbi:MAG: DUF1007 family protein [Rhodospirillaceae bacterium]|nr:DUF1007 family protein [Rhodospirillaceae bacterium]